VFGYVSEGRGRLAIGEDLDEGGEFVAGSVWGGRGIGDFESRGVRPYAVIGG